MLELSGEFEEDARFVEKRKFSLLTQAGFFEVFETLGGFIAQEHLFVEVERVLETAVFAEVPGQLGACGIGIGHEFEESFVVALQGSECLEDFRGTVGLECEAMRELFDRGLAKGFACGISPFGGTEISAVRGKCALSYNAFHGGVSGTGPGESCGELLFGFVAEIAHESLFVALGRQERDGAIARFALAREVGIPAGGEPVLVLVVVHALGGADMDLGTALHQGVGAVSSIFCGIYEIEASFNVSFSDLFADDRDCEVVVKFGVCDGGAERADLPGEQGKK